MEKILITGGAGFIGSNIAKALLDKDKSVICVDNLDPYYSPVLKKRNILPLLAKKDFRFYEENILEFGKLNQIFHKENPDKVIHLAAKVGVRSSLHNPKEYEEVNVRGTLNLLELARKFQIKQFVFGSSSSVYGNNKKTPFSENDWTDFQVSPYGVTKKASELLCRTYSYLYKIPTTCLRFFTVYGPSGRPDMAPYLFTEAIYKGLPLTKYGDGSSRRDYTYIDDIVDGIISSLSKIFDFEIINLGGGDMITLNDFISFIERLLKKEARVKGLLDQKGEVKTTYADINKAKRLLDYHPKYNIKKGMKKFVEWYLSKQVK